MTVYFDTLATRLRAEGMPAEEVTGTVEDLAAYTADSGTDPREEFGPPEEFATRLAGGAAAEPAPAAENWVWTADAFHELQHLNHFGDQGWEVERVDGVGRFVSRRDAGAPQRWEYRRETVRPRRESRAALAGRLAPDGWEPCGTWICFEYFKRPKAADLGPAAALTDVPVAPARRAFWSKGFAAYLLFLGAILAWSLLGSGDSGRTATLLLAGSATGLAIAGVWSVLARRSARRSSQG
ncbi:hypothetical protein [Actinomadura sp. 9N407]|uniref:hypothetical protein n=1 Tax=Actinomadura sp. 9N407 TaxID=3375154 RepID=UPI0037B3A444